MKRRYISHKCIIMLILICSIVIFVACPLPLKHIKFQKEGKAVKKYKTQFFNNRITMELEGFYWWIGPELELHLEISVSNNIEEDSLILKAENIFMTFNNKSLDWHTPGRDSLDMIITDRKYSITKCFRRQSLTDADVEYLSNTKFPLMITFNGFLFINDTAISIDTLYATSPELTFYDDW